jgi:hypothetical protein
MSKNHDFQTPIAFGNNLSNSNNKHPLVCINYTTGKKLAEAFTNLLKNANSGALNS